MESYRSEQAKQRDLEESSAKQRDQEILQSANPCLEWQEISCAQPSYEEALKPAELLHKPCLEWQEISCAQPSYEEALKPAELLHLVD